jgi:hypothetical protein
MALLYRDAVNDEILDAAARLAVRGCGPRGTLTRELAGAAVHDAFCSCVTDAEDEIEHRLSAIHEELINEVLKRAQGMLGMARSADGTATDAGRAPAQDKEAGRRSMDERLDGAEGDSFPASDPPSFTDPTRNIRGNPSLRR